MSFVSGSRQIGIEAVAKLFFEYLYGFFDLVASDRSDENLKLGTVQVRRSWRGIGRRSANDSFAPRQLTVV
jgi:hypothetical protein